MIINKYTFIKDYNLQKNIQNKFFKTLINKKNRK